MKDQSAMLSIEHLKVAVDGKEVLKGIDLTICPGEVHAIMGPNGAGKSTLSHLLCGHHGYEATAGQVLFHQKNLLELAPEARAQSGLFLAFQQPLEIPGVNNAYFLRAALNAQRRSRGEPEVDAMDFLGLVREKLALMQMDESFLGRGLNEGFSGGEKKRNEILQMLILEPSLALLDEIDSGLDIDALKAVATGINHWRNSERALLMVTHYPRLLEYIEPDYVHVLIDGCIVHSGDIGLAHELETRGYEWLMEKRGAMLA